MPLHITGLPAMGFPERLIAFEVWGQCKNSGMYFMQLTG